MPIRTQRDLALVGNQDFSGRIHRRHQALDKKVNAFPGKTEIMAGLKEGDRLGVVEVGCQDIPRDRATKDTVGGDDLLGEDLEKRVLQDRRDPV